MKPSQIWGCIILLMVYSINVIAQLPKCSNPAVIQNDCAYTCVVCDLDGLSTSSGHIVPGNAPPGYCTAVVNSIRYNSFVAG